MAEHPALIDALRAVVEEERGWRLVNDGSNGVFSAERPDHSAVVSTASPDGLVRAINACEERTEFNWSVGPPIISGRPLDLEDLEVQARQRQREAMKLSIAVGGRRIG